MQYEFKEGACNNETSYTFRGNSRGITPKTFVTCTLVSELIQYTI